MAVNSRSVSSPFRNTIAYGPADQQFGTLYTPVRDGPYPAAIVIHGGFWRSRYDLGHTGYLCLTLARLGIAAWNLEYRRVGNGGGWPQTCDDVVCGALHLLSLPFAAWCNVDPNRLIAIGHSAGGQLALWLAKQPALRLRGVVSLAPITDLRQAWALSLSGNAVADFLGGAPDEVGCRYAAASPVDLVPIGVRHLLVHGDADNVVPISMSHDYVSAARHQGDDCAMLALRSAGHLDLINPRSTVWTQVQDSIMSLLE